MTLTAAALDAPITVDLYVYTTHEVVVWEHLWSALRRRGVDAAFVVEPPGVNRAKGTMPDAANGWVDDKANGMLVDLLDADAERRIHTMLEARAIPWLDRSRPDADVVVTTQGVGWLDHYRGLRARTMYGVGLAASSYGHGSVNRSMDAVLVHGPFSRLAIEAHVAPDRIHAVGFPKWAPTWRAGIDRASARASLGVESGEQPVVAWLPTWAQHSSLDRFGAAFAQLSRDHTVLVKPHHNNVRFEQPRLAKLVESGVALIDADSLVPLVLAADVVVGDAPSGVVTEAILADRPAVGLLSGSDGARHELLAGVGDAVALCSDPAQLREAIVDATRDHRTTARQSWRTWLFTDHGGHDDDVAAEKLVELVLRHRSGGGRRVGSPTEVDGEIGRALDSDDPRHLLGALERGWSRWPGDPRLRRLLHRLPKHASIEELADWSRRARLFGFGADCPLHALGSDPTADVVGRLAASAIAASRFDDDAAAERFVHLCTVTPTDRFEESLALLDAVQADAVPAFLTHAANEPARAEAMAGLLASLGAAPEDITALLPRPAPRTVAPLEPVPS